MKTWMCTRWEHCPKRPAVEAEESPKCYTCWNPMTEVVFIRKAVAAPVDHPQDDLSPATEAAMESMYKHARTLTLFTLDELDSLAVDHYMTGVHVYSPTVGVVVMKMTARYLDDVHRLWEKIVKASPAHVQVQFDITNATQIMVAYVKHISAGTHPRDVVEDFVHERLDTLHTSKAICEYGVISWAGSVGHFWVSFGSGVINYRVAGA